MIVQQQGGRRDTTWSWNGSDWQDLGPSVNSPHSYGQLVSVGGLGVMLIGEGSEYNWTGKSWTNYQQLPQSVSLSLRPRDGWTAAYHEPTHELVLVGGRAGAGGNHLLADTAGWDGSKWKTLVQAPPSPKVPLASCSAKRAASGFGFGGNTDLSGASIAGEYCCRFLRAAFRPVPLACRCCAQPPWRRRFSIEPAWQPVDPARGCRSDLGCGRSGGDIRRPRLMCLWAIHHRQDPGRRPRHIVSRHL